VPLQSLGGSIGVARRCRPDLIDLADLILTWSDLNAPKRAVGRVIAQP
jgi:hypothetical protein